MKRQYFHTQCGSLLRNFSRIDLLYFLFSLGVLTTRRTRYCMHARMFSCFSLVRLSVTLWTVPREAPLTMGFSRQESWSGLPFPREIFPTQGLNPGLPHCRQTLYYLSHQGSPWTEPNQPPVPGNHLSDFCLYSFVVFRLSSKCNHSICNLCIWLLSVQCLEIFSHCCVYL